MKTICFYLPQYHPTEENNKWWGQGFTEWTNVTKALPRFRGHYQPQLPSDLGFYDLRLEETRVAQAALAAEYGIGGFCYYHYWFSGKLMLERPLLEMLESGKPDFPFCLCWANEKWIRSWDNETQEVLLDQTYNDQEHLDHIQWLMPFLKDSRYINVAGKPVLLVYRVDEIPNIVEKLNIWRKYAVSQGLPGLYLCVVNNYKNTLSAEKLIEYGFDAVVDFQPNGRDFPNRKKINFLKYAVPRILNKVAGVLRIKNFKKFPVTDEYSYREIINKISLKKATSHHVFPTAFPSWDNSPRKKVNATVLQNEDAELFRKFLEISKKQVSSYSEQEQIVFINAWNEWAEGCHLEPDLKHGRKFLEVVKAVFADK